MNAPPNIGSRVRLSALAVGRLERSPGRMRDPEKTGTVTKHTPGGRRGMLAVVRWAEDLPLEALHPSYLESAP